MSWQGFSKPNTTPTPNEFYDRALAEIDSLAELKCVLYVIRRTFGWGKLVDRIAYSQFEHGIWTTNSETGERERVDHGTGLSTPSIAKGLKRAVEHKYLVSYILCPHCQNPIADRDTIEYSMKPRTGEESTTIQKIVAPAQCPFCQNKLRGQEEIYYSLYFADTDFDQLKGLSGPTKTFLSRLPKLFSRQEKITASLQEKTGAGRPKDFWDLARQTQEHQQKRDYPLEYLSAVTANLLHTALPSYEARLKEKWHNPLASLLSAADNDIDRVEKALRQATQQAEEQGWPATTPHSLHDTAMQFLTGSGQQAANPLERMRQL